MMARQRKKRISASDVMTSKTLRWLELTSVLLQPRVPLTRDEIFERIAAYGLERQMAASDHVVRPGTAGESARRKFERDKGDLRIRGLMVETIRIAGGGNSSGQVGYVLRPAGDRPVRLHVSAGANPASQSSQTDWYVGAEDLGVIDDCLTRLGALRGHPLHQAAASAQRAINAGTVDGELGGSRPAQLMPQEQLALQVSLLLETRGASIAGRLARAWNPDAD
jgi:hypothetical protein